jgi:hypothetical protein
MIALATAFLALAGDDARVEKEFVEAVRAVQLEHSDSLGRSPAQDLLANLIWRQGAQAVPVYLRIAERCKTPAPTAEVDLCKRALKAAAEFPEAEDVGKLRSILLETAAAEVRREAVETLFARPSIDRLDLLRVATAHATEGWERNWYVGQLIGAGDPLGASLIDQLLAAHSYAELRDELLLAKRALLSANECLLFHSEIRENRLDCDYVCKRRCRTFSYQRVDAAECPPAPIRDR